MLYTSFHRPKKNTINITMLFCSTRNDTAYFGQQCFILTTLLVPLLFLLMIPYTAEAQQQQQQQQQQRPNIVILFADDVGQGDVPGYWENAEGGSNIVVDNMSNLQDIIDHGIVFTDAHSTPLCAQSRYVLLSGRYQHYARSPSGLSSLGDHGAFDNGQKSIANILQEHGNYHTAAIGKWHLGGKINPNGQQIDKTKVGYLTNTDKHNWTIPIGEGPNELGFDYSYITPGGIQSPPYSFFRNGILDTQPEDIRYWEAGEYEIKESNGDISNIYKKGGEGDMKWNSAEYNKLLVHETEAFLDEHLQGQRNTDPFFVYTAFGSVHLPHSPPKFYNRTKVKYRYPTRHQDMLYEMDLAIGSILAALEQRNLLENTIIIFTSDNGGIKEQVTGYGYSSGPLRGNKGSLFEGGHRIPFFVRYDGVFPAGERRNQLIGLNDIYATLLDLANIKMPDDQKLQSTSFQEQIFSENVKGRTTLGVWRISWGTIRGAMIRRDNLKLVMETNPLRFYLFNLETDLFEERDLGYNIQNTPIMWSMIHQLTEIGPCPRDKWGKFTLQNQLTEIGRPHRRKKKQGTVVIPKPYVGEDETVSCKFFQKNPQELCFQFQKTAEENCPYTCSPYFNLERYETCKATKLYPPRKVCKDSNEEFWMNGAIRTCSTYVQSKNKKNELCNKFTAQYMCPGTCKKNCS